MLRNVSFAAVFVACAPALAADLPSLRGAIVEDLPQVAMWDGAYVGAHAGFGLTRPHYVEDHPQYNTNPSMTGVRAGALAGYNFQFGDLVLGVEGDVALGSLKEGPAFGAAYNNYTQITQRWQANARVRVGYAMGSVMPFVAAGASWANFTADDVDPGYGKATRTVAGWNLGAGMDYQIAPSWFLRGEYVYSAFARANYLIEADKECHTFVARMTPRSHMFRLALAYRFGEAPKASAPYVVARY